MSNVEICEKNCTFYSFFTKSKEAMFITTKEGTFIDVNESFLKLLGYQREELLGKKTESIYESGDDRKSYVQIMEEEGVVHDYRITLKGADGRNLFCLIDAIHWEEGLQKAGYYGIIRTRIEIINSFQNYFDELKRERKQIQEERKTLLSDTMLLMRYGSDELLDYAQKTGKNPLASGRQKVSVLFFDIIGSTAIAENLDPEIFTSFLSDVFIDIMDLIYGNQGSVNKMLGDGLMATFGAPLKTGMDAFNAVNAAKKIQEYLMTYNDVRPDYLTKPLQAGIGIATGTVFAGVIGSIRREEYTVLGDTVNVASRLESLTRKLDSQILIDQNTYEEVKNHFTARKRFRGKLKGRKELLQLFSI